MPKHFTAARFFSVTSVAAFLIGVSEMILMISPFAAYFYAAYSPVLSLTEAHPSLIWLTDFFVPHLSKAGSGWLGALVALRPYLAFTGLALFVIHAAYLYWMKFVKKRVATELLYRYVRHPQYLAFALAGLGFILYWPRFINLLFYFAMLIGYYALADAEERRMERRFGEQYVVYKQRTAMFIPCWLPARPIHAYVALTLLLVLGLASGFLLRAAAIRHLHHAALTNALLVFLEEPDGASQSRVEAEVARVLDTQPERDGRMPVFYVTGDETYHLLLDSGMTREALDRIELPDALWFLVRASASYCAPNRTCPAMRSAEEALRVNVVRRLERVYYLPKDGTGNVAEYALPRNSTYPHEQVPLL